MCRDSPQEPYCALPTAPFDEASTNLEIALAYLNRGWGVVPQICGAKKPLVKWRKLQDRLPNAAELTTWFTQWWDGGIALILGHVSGIFVLDVDGEEAHLALVGKKHTYRAIAVNTVGLKSNPSALATPSP